MKNDFLIVLVTTNNKKQAKNIAEILLRHKLVACVNVVSPIESMYWWQGKIESSKECLMVIKTTKFNFAKLEKKIKEVHSYENPEIIALKLDKGSQAYLNWITQSVTTKRISTRLFELCF